jgi:hypothetical protein
MNKLSDDRYFMGVLRNKEGQYWNEDFGWTSDYRLGTVFMGENHKEEFPVPSGAEWSIAWFVYDA